MMMTTQQFIYSRNNTLWYIPTALLILILLLLQPLPLRAQTTGGKGPVSINDLIPQDEAFYLQSAMNFGSNAGGYWDIDDEDGNVKTLARIRVGTLAAQVKDKQFVFTSASDTRFLKLHIAGLAGFVELMDSCGTNGSGLQIMKPAETPAQEFTLHYTGNGKFKIFNRAGKLITMLNRSTEDGTKLHVWEAHEGPWTEWVLISAETGKPLLLEQAIREARGAGFAEIPAGKNFYIQSAMAFGTTLQGFWDLPGVSYPQKGNPLQVYTLTDFAGDRMYSLQYQPDNPAVYGIRISGNPALLLDAGSTNPANGTQVQLGENKSGSSREFRLRATGGGRYKIVHTSGKVLCVRNRVTDNGTAVHFWDDHAGPWTEWYLIDAETNKPFGLELPITVSTAEVAELTAEQKGDMREIGQAYSQAVRLENSSGAVLQAVQGVFSTAQAVANASNGIAGLQGSIDKSTSALQPFAILPLFGAPVQVLQTGLGIVKGQLGTVQKGIAGLQSSVITPAYDNAAFTMQKVVAVQAQLQRFALRLQQVQQQALVKAKQGKLDAAALRQTALAASRVTAQFAAMEQSLQPIVQGSNAFAKSGEPLKQMAEGINRVRAVLGSAEKMAGEINAILDARFTREVDLEVKKVRVDISLRDVIAGKGTGEVFDKFVNPWMQDIMAPIVNTLQAKIPDLPGTELFAPAMQEALSYTAAMRNSAKGIESVSTAILPAVTEFEKSAALVSVP